jgi:hypothetical protein
VSVKERSSDRNSTLCESFASLCQRHRQHRGMIKLSHSFCIICGLSFQDVRQRASGSHFPCLKIVLRWNAESVRYSIEKREYGDDVDGFSDLIFVPARISKFLNVVRCRAISGIGNLLDIIQQ